MDMPLGGQRAVALHTRANLNLTAYEFDGHWRALTVHQTVQRFVERHRSQSSNDEPLRLGQLTLLRNYLAVLVQGLGTTVTIGKRMLLRGLAVKTPHRNRSTTPCC